MEKSNVIVDTCIWIEYFKGLSEIKETLSTLIIEKSLFLCGIVVYELLQGIKNLKEREMIKSDFKALPYLEMNITTWERAGNLSLYLRNRGIILPTSDLFLASLAMENKCMVFTKDTHFDKVPDVSLYKPKGFVE